MPLCINCNIAIHPTQPYEYHALSMSPEIVSIVEEWTAQEVTDGDRICQECMNFLLIELKNRNEHIIGDRKLGHQSVCVCCGISLLRRTGRRPRPLPDGQPERAYIATIISPRQMPDNAQACNACWQRAHYKNIQERMEPGDAQETDYTTIESRSSSPSVAESVSEFSPENIDSVIQKRNTYVELVGYSRTADTSSHCFVPECTNPERLRVRMYLKKQILMDYKLYISPSARVCKEHASINNWELLKEFQFTTQFTLTHIVEMLDLLRNKTIK